MNFTELLQEAPISIIAQKAQEQGIKARIVGGFVRDQLLKRPSKDIDIVCEGDGIRLAEAVASEREGAHVHVFKNFGTAMVQWEDWVLEFVGARKESYRGDSRKPEVEAGSFAEDELRRDFSINTMSISLEKESFACLIDPFDGQKDLKRKMIRTPTDPQITFSDDPLRMMRAIRFATQLDFDIEPDTYEAIMLQKDRIAIVSMERIMDELNKIILSPKPSSGFTFLFHTGLLDLFFPQMGKLAGVEVIDGHAHKDNFYHTLKVLDNLCQTSDDLWLRWAALLHDIAKPATKKYYKNQGWTFHGHEELGARMVPELFRQLKLPMNEKMRYVQKLVRLHLRPIALVKETVTDTALRRLLFEAGDDLDDLMKLCRADITSKDGNRVKRYLENFDKVEQKLTEVEARDHVRNLQPVITGEHIMQYFDIRPGKDIGLIKNAIKEAILEGRISNDWEPGFKLMVESAASLGYTLKEKPI